MALDARVEEQGLTFVEICGVQVDVRIPPSVQQFFRKQWEQWRWGAIKGMTIPDYDEKGREITEERREQYKKAFRGIYLTRYEHLILGSSYHPPDPFLPLAAQADKIRTDKIPNFETKKTPLEEIIEDRRQQFPLGDYLSSKAAVFIPDFYKNTHFLPQDILVAIERPDISPDGRVPIPRVIGISKKKPDGSTETLTISDAILGKIQFPAVRVISEMGIKLREVFDYQKGYRIELAK